MIKTDSHLHSWFSGDSDTPMEEMILSGIRSGLDSVCFTEHFDPDFPEAEDPGDFTLDFDAYEEEYLRLKKKYEDRIEILHGVEVGVQPHLARTCREFYEEYGDRYDFIIHSTHVVDRLDPYYGAYFASYSDPKKAVRNYFEVMLENLHTFDHYQTVAHLDYICRYEPLPRTPFHYEEYGEVIDPILEHIISRDKCLEVNTAGWKYGMEDPNPNRQILKRYFELGGRKITIGSDGHKPEHLAYDFSRLSPFLREIGFDRYIYFRKKEPCQIILQ